MSATFSLKWKPPSENSIDFKLVLRFLPSSEQPDKPDFYAKPVFELHTWCGRQAYEFWDVMMVKDEEWERCVHALTSAYSEIQLRMIIVHEFTA